MIIARVENGMDSEAEKIQDLLEKTATKLDNISKKIMERSKEAIKKAIRMGNCMKDGKVHIERVVN